MAYPHDLGTPQATHRDQCPRIQQRTLQNGELAYKQRLEEGQPLGWEKQEWTVDQAMENGPFIDGLPITSGDFP